MVYTAIVCPYMYMGRYCPKEGKNGEKLTLFRTIPFDNAYYLKEDSLILSATIEGRRIETIEVSLDTLKVVQSRGVCNKNTEYHKQIVSLINANRKLIRQGMRATA